MKEGCRFRVPQLLMLPTDRGHLVAARLSDLVAQTAIQNAELNKRWTDVRVSLAQFKP